MYDLPSEFPDEPGLPDEFHDYQPQFLSRTLQLQNYADNRYFTGTDLNVYYDVHHTLWHKRPDWFLAVDVPRWYDNRDWRMSYVTWQEGKSPAVVIEFLSFNTEKEDLGRFYRKSDKVSGSDIEPDLTDTFVALTESDKQQKKSSPDKFTVYEQYLKVPHYIVYSRYTQKLRYFKHNGQSYEEQPLNSQVPLIWLPNLSIGLGLWNDYFEEAPGPLLRWCDADGNWLLTDTEREKAAKEKAQQEANKLANKLRELGIDPESL